MLCARFCPVVLGGSIEDTGDTRRKLLLYCPCGTGSHHPECRPEKYRKIEYILKIQHHNFVSQANKDIY